MPEAALDPWSRITDGTPQRWVDNGLFCQLITAGQFDGYNRSIAEFTGSPSFFVTWREMTDIPRSSMGHTPNGLSASGGPVVFSFTVTADQVRLNRGDSGGGGSTFFFDIKAGVVHTYYLELHNNLSYVCYIDGVAVNSGPYPSAFPNGSGAIQWWARCQNDPTQSSKWDFVRYGVIPTDHSGDFDRNGVVDQTDLYFFIDCLLGPDYDAAGPGCKWADLNADGKADAADIQLFISAMMPN